MSVFGLSLAACDDTETDMEPAPMTSVSSTSSDETPENTSESTLKGEDENVKLAGKYEVASMFSGDQDLSAEYQDVVLELNADGSLKIEGSRGTVRGNYRVMGHTVLLFLNNNDLYEQFNAPSWKLLEVEVNSVSLATTNMDAPRYSMTLFRIPEERVGPKRG